MATTVKRTIKIKKYLDIVEEYTADAAITPGHLLELTTTGVKVHATAGGNVKGHLFALEDELQGNGIATAYAVSAKTQVWVAQRGEQVYALLANGETATIGMQLESAGDGTLQEHTPDVDSASDVTTIYGNQIVGIALEAVDMSGSSAVDPNGRIKIMVI